MTFDSGLSESQPRSAPWSSDVPLNERVCGPNESGFLRRLACGRRHTLALALVGLALASAGSAQARFSGVQGHWLAFERTEGGSTDIFVARPGGPGYNVTRSAATDEHPAWDIPPDDAYCSEPSQVPSHHRLAFDSRAAGGNADIFRVDVAGLETNPAAPAAVGVPVNITNSPGANDTAPAWGTDRIVPPGGGTPLHLVAFTSDRDSNQDGRPDRDIFVVDETGANLVNLTHDDADDTNPDWSPDGRYVAFESTRSGISQIWAVPITITTTGIVGGAPYQITSGPDAAHDPTWLGHSPQFGDPGGPDDQQIVYSVDQGGRSYLDTIVQDITDSSAAPFGSLAGPPPRTQQLTGDPGDDSAPAWSADGWGVVFASTGGGTRHSLAILRGSDSQPLTLQAGPIVAPSGDDTNPDWQPFYNCAQPHPQMPAPAPVTRTPKSAGSAGGSGGAAAGGSGSGAAPAPANRGDRAETPKIAVRDVAIRVVRSHGRRVLSVIVMVDQAASAELRLMREHRVVAHKRYRLHRGSNRMRLALPRKAKPGRYLLALKIRGAGATRKLVRAVRVRP